jgi:hypothetical protein
MEEDDDPHYVIEDTILEEPQSSVFDDEYSDPENVSYGIALSDESTDVDDQGSLLYPNKVENDFSASLPPSYYRVGGLYSREPITEVMDISGQEPVSAPLSSSEHEHDTEKNLGLINSSRDTNLTTDGLNYSADDTLLDEGSSTFRASSSVGTIRASSRSALDAWAEERLQITPVQMSYSENAQVVDGSGWDGHAARNGGHAGKWEGDSGDQPDDGEHDDHDDYYWQGAGGGDGGDDDGRDSDGRRQRLRSSFSTPSDSETEGSEDDYGEEESRRDERPPLAKKSMGDTGEPSSGTSTMTTTDDDVPLAQRIPTALDAQKTIRKQVRDEKEARRKARAAKRGQEASREPAKSPPQAVTVPGRDAATKSNAASADRHFAIEDLKQKLLNLQTTDSSSPSASLSHKSSASSTGFISSRDRLTRPRSHTNERIVTPDSHKDQSLRVPRSLHKAQSKDADALADANGRAVSSSRSRHHTDEVLPSSHGAKPRPSRDVEKRARARSVDDSKRSTRPSADDHRSSHRQPVPPMPAEVLASLASSTAKNDVSHQRIFVGDRERFNIVEISSSTTAQDVLDSLESQGAFNGLHGVGEWMVYEVC